MIIQGSRLASASQGRFPFKLSESIRPIDYRDEKIAFTGPVVVTGSIEQNGSLYLVTGDVQAEVVLECSRCLGEVRYPVRTSFIQEYREGGADADRLVADRDRIDLYGPVVESILLELPIKVVCREECKGLCPVCGSNRNINECGCSRDEIDPRMLALKKLLEEK
jgi:uncharacterized protein